MIHAGYRLARTVTARWGYLPVLYLLFLVIAWRNFFGESLWLDETLSVWVAQGSFAEIIAQARTYQPQGPLYFLVLSLWTACFGLSEFALRSCSLAFFVSAAVTLYLLARRFSTAEFASIALGIFITFDGVLRSLSARPYALALSLAFLSTYAVVRWCEEGGRRWQLFHGVAFVLCGYTHVLFLLIAGLHLALWRMIGRGKSARDVLISIGAILLALGPVFSTAFSLARSTSICSIGETPTLGSWLRMVVSTPLVIYLVFPLIVALLMVRGSRVRITEPFRLCLYFAWYVIPPTLFLLISHIAGGATFIDRYFLWAFAGGALGCAAVMTALEPWGARAVAVLVMVVLMSVRESGRQWAVENWRDAADAVKAIAEQESICVLYQPGLVEAEDPEYLKDMRHRDYLRAPLHYYEVPGEVVVLPSHLEGADRSELRDAILTRASKENRLVFIGLRQRVGRTGQTTDRYYKNLVGLKGYSIREIPGFGRVSVFLATKTS